MKSDSWKPLVLPAIIVFVCIISAYITSWIGMQIFELGRQRGLSDALRADQTEDSPRVSEYLMVLRCDLETGELTRHRTDYLMSADAIEPFSERYLVLGDGEITERTVKGDPYMHMHGPPRWVIDRVTVTDKEVLVFYRDAIL